MVRVKLEDVVRRVNELERETKELDQSIDELTNNHSNGNAGVIILRAALQTVMSDISLIEGITMFCDCPESSVKGVSCVQHIEGTLYIDTNEI